MTREQWRERVDEASLVAGQAASLLEAVMAGHEGSLVEQLAGIERLVREARAIINSVYSA